MRAICVTGSATNARTTNPTTLPIKECTVAVQRAKAASPRCAMGKPSSVVATDEGAPGMLMRMADTAPAYTPETKSPSIVPIARFTGHEKVIDTSRAVAMVTERPGTAPTRSPTREPTKV